MNFARLTIVVRQALSRFPRVGYGVQMSMSAEFQGQPEAAPAYAVEISDLERSLAAQYRARIESFDLRASRRGRERLEQILAEERSGSHASVGRHVRVGA